MVLIPGTIIVGGNLLLPVLATFGSWHGDFLLTMVIIFLFRRSGANPKPQEDRIQIACTEHTQLFRPTDATLGLLNGDGVLVGQQQCGTGDGLLPAVKQDFTQQGTVPTSLDVIGKAQPTGCKEVTPFHLDNLLPECFILRAGYGMEIHSDCS